MASSMNNKTFDPFAQTITLTISNNSTLPLTLPDLNAYIIYTVHLALIYASQLGATVLIIPMLLLLTPTAKARRPIFLLNLVSLILNMIRLVLMSLYLVSAFSLPYAYFAADYSRVPSHDYANSVAADIFTLMLLIAVEASLVLQARVVCLTLPKGQQRAILGISAIVAGLAIGFRLALTIENVGAILHAADFSVRGQFLGSAANITVTVSIWVFCGLFVAKLLWSIRERRRMNMRALRAVKIVVVGGVQTMVIPAIFAILAYFTKIPETGSVVLTLVAIMLPLSSLWASSQVNEQSSAHQNTPAGKLLVTPGSEGSQGSTQPLKGRGSSTNSHSASAGAGSSSGWSGKDYQSGSTTMTETLGSMSDSPLCSKHGDDFQMANIRNSTGYTGGGSASRAPGGVEAPGIGPHSEGVVVKKEYLVMSEGV